MEVSGFMTKIAKVKIRTQDYPLRWNRKQYFKLALRARDALDPT